MTSADEKILNIFLMLESSTRYKNNKVVIGLNYTIIFYRAILKPRAKKETKLEKMYN